MQNWPRGRYFTQWHYLSANNAKQDSALLWRHNERHGVSNHQPTKGQKREKMFPFDDVIMSGEEL